MSSLGSYLALTKPRLLPLVLLSGLPALWLASQGGPDPAWAVLVLLGISLAAGSANALNSYLEREIDARMTRTATRPLPAGRLRPQRALIFGLTLGALGPGLLLAIGGPAPALVALAGILFYVFVYTLWLKPRTPAAVVIGGVSGAISPLIADAAVDGRIGPVGLLLFALVFVWQPPHFWAIALFRRAEYEAAGFRLLPSTAGEAATHRRIVAWILALVPVTLLPLWLTDLGGVYGAAAVLLGGWFLWHGVRLLREASIEAARRLFRVSVLYLMLLLLAMLADVALAAVLARVEGTNGGLDLSFLPGVNATLNAIATVLLLRGRQLIRQGRREAHRRTMWAAFGTSTLFLSLYVLHKAWRSFENTTYNVEWAQPIYLTLLASHVVLAMTVPALAIALIWLGSRERFEMHRRVARIAWPVWLYVSITGVLIYVLLYHLNVPLA